MINEKLPSYYYRTDLCYRPFNHADFVGIMGCGFQVKKGVAKDHVDDFYSHYAIVYVLRGSGVFIDHKNRKHPIGPGCVFQRNPRYKHTLLIDPDSEWAECFIGLKHTEVHDPGLKSNIISHGCEEIGWRDHASKVPDYTLNILEYMDIIDVNQAILTPGVKLKYVKQFDNIISEMKNSTPRDLVHIQLQILQLIAELATGDNEKYGDSYENDLIQKICHIIAENPADRTSFPQLLDGIGLSYSRLRTLFKQKMGISLEKFRIMQRIQKSCDHLSQGKHNIGEVAHIMGYKDQFAFSTQFKKVTGMSPKEFQKQFL